MASKLVLAVPSKGRLQENAASFLAGIGLKIAQRGNVRSYRGSLDGIDDVEIAFLSAGEIVRELAAGNIHLGITGRDLIEETINDWRQRVDLVLPLGFGQANVIVAVPNAWIDVNAMADLDDVAHEFRRHHGRKLKVATKYFNLTRRFFAGHGIADYRIVESLGATEGTPAAGTADLIVDITSTGSTLAANALKQISDGTILESEAYLVAAMMAPWRGARDGLASLRQNVVAGSDAEGALERLIQKVAKRG